MMDRSFWSLSVSSSRVVTGCPRGPDPRAAGLGRRSDLIRRLEIGRACYIHRDAATFVRVARPAPSPLSSPTARAPVVLPIPRRPSPVPPAGPVCRGGQSR